MWIQSLLMLASTLQDSKHFKVSAFNRSLKVSLREEKKKKKKGKPSLLLLSFSSCAPTKKGKLLLLLDFSCYEKKMTELTMGNVVRGWLWFGSLWTTLILTGSHFKKEWQFLFVLLNKAIKILQLWLLALFKMTGKCAKKKKTMEGIKPRRRSNSFFNRCPSLLTFFYFPFGSRPLRFRRLLEFGSFNKKKPQTNTNSEAVMNRKSWEAACVFH